MTDFSVNSLRGGWQQACWGWGLGEPAASHWRQWLNIDGALGRDKGQIVAELGYFRPLPSGKNVAIMTDR